MHPRINVLFVCGRNNRRSPTAARIFRDDPRMNVRAAGLGETSKRRIAEEDVRWAQLILVMERKYVVRLREAFRRLDELPPIESLNISDEYIFMDPELIPLLHETVTAALEAYHLEREAGNDPAD